MVFDSWIVVASIKLAYVMDLVSSGSGFGVCGGLLWCDFSLFNGFVLCKCLRAHGGCLGIRGR